MRRSGILIKQYMCRGLFQRGIWLFSSCPEMELETMTVKVTIQDFVADVVSELFFRNTQQVSKEIMFIFPVDSDTVVHTFYATMGDTRIEAMLWEKEEAQHLCKATSGMENLRYLQDQWDLWGPVFACFLGTLPPNREVTISLCYVQELPLHPDGAALFCWPHELFPQRNYLSYISSEEGMFENLHFSICLKSAHGVSHVAINSSYTPLQYTAPDQTSAEVSLKLPPWMQDDLNLLVYYRGSHTHSAVVERRDPKAPPGSLLGDPVVMVTLTPNIPEVVPSSGQLGEFLFLMDRSLFQDAQNTLLFLLKSLPLGCYFNIYSFGATFKAFYPQSVEYTQESMDNAVRCLSSICPDLGGCDLLGLLKSIYSTPLIHGNLRQLFIFIQRKISSEEEAVMAEVYRYRDHHRCFCFPTNRCDSFNLSQAMALETKGECVCIHSRMDMASEAVKCLRRALQPMASGISLHWDLPPGLEVSMIRKAPEMIFQGHQSSVYAQIRGQAQDVELGEGAVSLQYHVGSQSFNYTLRFSLFPSADDRLPVHRMAMMHLLWKLAWEGTSRAEKDIQHSAVKSSISLGVPSPFTSGVAVLMKQRDAWHHDSLPPDSSTLFSSSCNLVPCQLLWLRGFRPVWFKSTKFWIVQKCQFCLEVLDRKAPDTEALTQLSASCKEREPSSEEQVMEEPPASNISWDWKISPLSTRLCDFSSLRVVVALQKANGSWAFTAALASALGLSNADVDGQRPTEPTAWATVLALVWLHQYKWKVPWSELLEAKACRWLRDQAEVQLDECLEAANSLLGCFVEPTVFRI
ncbi:von Willebrand factor A domain-containing protein 5A-like isoform X1 [Grus americana]|uniref:von Willebrand factor A domain-containing protein 5A-like isoform X1 n=2 Tax=Grus americana TaxID=9117 RepID=UPI0024077F4F|nr:von Willebrand factor A domain-containing protein 5A-like isoform X1 [Grus americana]XP_054657266.1 von Willebrand factor A domain-containing protein 5A-like isoform X1 [Grus americana]